MLRALRARMYFSVTNGIKCDKTVALIGCDIETLKKHIEGMFSVGMNWDNYGRNGWHIDHIKPCAKFDLSNEIEQRECFHYTNLQPLWEPDNCKKGAKYSQLEYKAK